MAIGGERRRTDKFNDDATFNCSTMILFRRIIMMFGDFIIIELTVATFIHVARLHLPYAYTPNCIFYVIAARERIKTISACSRFNPHPRSTHGLAQLMEHIIRWPKKYSANAAVCVCVCKVPQCVCIRTI